MLSSSFSSTCLGILSMSPKGIPAVAIGHRRWKECCTYQCWPYRSMSSRLYTLRFPECNANALSWCGWPATSPRAVTLQHRTEETCIAQQAKTPRSWSRLAHNVSNNLTATNGISKHALQHYQQLWPQLELPDSVLTL